MNIDPKLLDFIIVDVKKKVNTDNFSLYLYGHYQFEVNHMTANDGWTKICKDAEKEHILEKRNAVIMLKGGGRQRELIIHYGLRYNTAELVRSIIEL